MKRIVTFDGQSVWRVREIDTDRVPIERSSDDESPAAEINEQQGWSDEDETHELRRDHDDRYEDTERHLQTRR